MRDKASEKRGQSDTEKPFLEHLEDLRVTLMKIVGTLLVTSILCFVFKSELMDFITHPVKLAQLDKVGIQDLPEDFLVMNGDILTDLSFDRFFEFHKENGACTSIATYSKQVRIDYGIVESNPGDEIIGYNEKPSLKYHVSMGIYAFNYSVHKYIKKGQYFDFPDLVKLLIKKRERVMSFPFDGYWKDIGCHDDFVAAAEDFSSMKEKFIKESFTLKI